MMVLEHLRLFQAIVERGSLAEAGRAMGLSSTTVSERLAALESDLGARLLNRTTRAINMTEAGRALYDGARRLLAEEEELRARVVTGIESLAGPIRISAPIDFGRERVAPALDAFVEEYPGVDVELVLTDGYVDLVLDAVDIAIRFGALADSSLRVRRIGDSRRIVCASPRYLDQHGAPATPTDLHDHDCLRMRFGMHLDRRWHFQKRGRKFTVNVSGSRVANDGALVRRWCVQGYGIALKSHWDVAADLEHGRLVELLAEFAPPKTPLQMVFPPGGSEPRRVKAFAEHLLSTLSASRP